MRIYSGWLFKTHIGVLEFSHRLLFKPLHQCFSNFENSYVLEIYDVLNLITTILLEIGLNIDLSNKCGYVGFVSTYNKPFCLIYMF